MPGRLHGKVAMITGGNSGIGEATARLFTREGANAAILARREAEGRAVEKGIRAEGGEVTFIPCDVTDRKSVDAAVAQTVSAYGGLHILINNAGGGAREMFPDESDETWERVLRINLTACFFTCRAVWPHLIQAGGGAIVNVSSLAAIRTGSGLPYETTKAALLGLTRSVAVTHARDKIRVNTILPGLINSSMVRRLVGDREDRVAPRIPMRRQGTPWEIAKAIVFLLSDDASYITGTELIVDGGLSAR